MSKTVSSSIKSAFEGVIFDGERLSDALKSLGSNLASSTLSQAISPCTKLWVPNLAVVCRLFSPEYFPSLMEQRSLEGGLQPSPKVELLTGLPRFQCVAEPV